MVHNTELLELFCYVVNLLKLFIFFFFFFKFIPLKPIKYNEIKKTTTLGMIVWCPLNSSMDH